MPWPPQTKVTCPVIVTITGATANVEKEGRCEGNKSKFRQLFPITYGLVGYRLTPTRLNLSVPLRLLKRIYASSRLKGAVGPPLLFLYLENGLFTHPVVPLLGGPLFNSTLLHGLGTQLHLYRHHLLSTSSGRIGLRSRAIH